MTALRLVGLVVMALLIGGALILAVACARAFIGMDDDDAPDRESDLAKVLPREVTDQVRQEQRDRRRR